MRLSTLARIVVATMLLPILIAPAAHAWGRDGHMLINKLAAENLPADVPYFLRNGNGVDVMEWMGPEPDRWKQRDAEPSWSPPNPPTTSSTTSGPSMEQQAAPLEVKTASTATTSPASAMTSSATSPPPFPSTLRSRPSRTVGFQPWQVEEVWQRLKSRLPRVPQAHRRQRRHRARPGRHSLRRRLARPLRRRRLPAPAQHHQYNGWTGPNPNHYTTDHKIHAQFESIFVSADIKPADVAPLVAAAQPPSSTTRWTQYWNYLHHSNTLVEKVYQLGERRRLQRRRHHRSQGLHRRASGCRSHRTPRPHPLRLGPQRRSRSGIPRPPIARQRELASGT